MNVGSAGLWLGGSLSCDFATPSTGDCICVLVIVIDTVTCITRPLPLVMGASGLVRRGFASSCLLFPSLAHACTICHSNTAQLVRSGIFNSSFLHTLFLISLPALLLCVAVVAVHFVMPDLEINRAGSDADCCRPSGRICAQGAK
jgi:hypothetical protein